MLHTPTEEGWGSSSSTENGSFPSPPFCSSLQLGVISKGERG